MALDRGQRGMQVGPGAGVEGGGQFQRQVFRQHGDARALRGGRAQHGGLAFGERSEIRGRLDRIFRDGDLHRAVSSGRNQNVSAWSTSPWPISFHGRRIVMPGRRS